MSRPEALAQFSEHRLGHRFANARLLEQALSHRSHGPDHNERLEFLGDSVLDCVVSAELYARFPHAPEGDLTRLAGSLVRVESLADIARTLGLAELLRFDRRPVGSGLDAGPSMVMMGDALEAVFGAVFLDAGYEAARKAILRAYGPLIETLEVESVSKDAKTRLQELLQAKHQRLPDYRIVSKQNAPQHNVFEVECLVAELGLSATGSGTSRQRAEQQAAKAMLDKLGA